MPDRRAPRPRNARRRARRRPAGQHDVARRRSRAHHHRGAPARRILDDLERERHAGHSSRGRRESRAVGGIAQQRLPDSLSEDPALAARRPEDLPLALRAVGIRSSASRPPRRVEATATLRARRDRDPGQARHLLLSVDADRHLGVLARAVPLSTPAPVHSSGSRSQCSREDEPAGQQQRRWRSTARGGGPRAPSIRAAPPGASADRSSPPGARATGWCAATPGRRCTACCAVAPHARTLDRIGHVVGVEQHHVDQRQQRLDRLLVTVGRPHDGRHLRDQHGVDDRLAARAGARGRDRSRRSRA